MKNVSMQFQVNQSFENALQQRSFLKQKMGSQQYAVGKQGSFNFQAMRGIQLKDLDADNDFFMIPSEQNERLDPDHFDDDVLS